MVSIADCAWGRRLTSMMKPTRITLGVPRPRAHGTLATGPGEGRASETEEV